MNIDRDNGIYEAVIYGEKLIMRKTLVSDIVYVTGIEKLPGNRDFILGNTAEEHIRNLENPLILHMIIQKADSGDPVGFVLLSKGESIKRGNLELRRIVVAEKGMGFGREAIRMIKKLAFEQLGFHRLWLDVFSSNLVAKKLYASEGFVTEGVQRECLKSEYGTYESMEMMSVLETETHIRV